MNQIFNYEGSSITFNQGDSVMVNATEMAKAFGKRTRDFLKTRAAKRFLEALSEGRKVASSDLLQVTYGDGGGTWMHEDVALEFARWLSPRFAIWCNDRIKELLSTGRTKLNESSLADLLEVSAKAIRDKDLVIRELAPKAAFVDQVFDTGQLIDIGQAAKILNLGYGRNTLFKKLRGLGIFFRNRNEPQQRYIDQKLFVMKEKWINDDHGEGFIVIKTLVTQKGLKYLQDLLGEPVPNRPIAVMM